MASGSRVQRMRWDNTPASACATRQGGDKPQSQKSRPGRQSTEQIPMDLFPEVEHRGPSLGNTLQVHCSWSTVLCSYSATPINYLPQHRRAGSAGSALLPLTQWVPGRAQRCRGQTQQHGRAGSAGSPLLLPTQWVPGRAQRRGAEGRLNSMGEPGQQGPLRCLPHSGPGYESREIARGSCTPLGKILRVMLSLRPKQHINQSIWEAPSRAQEDNQRKPSPKSELITAPGGTACKVGPGQPP